MATSLITQKSQAKDSWYQWQWQQQNAVSSIDQLLQTFPGLSDNSIYAVKKNLESRRIRITPYTLSLIQRTEDNLEPRNDDPVWRQIIPSWNNEGNTNYSYDGQTENWEMPHEMVTPIAQHKYDNRVIIRLSNTCHSYCQFCYESLRTLEKHSSKLPLQPKDWEDTLDYLSNNLAIEEVILSGGEPLMHNDEQLERVLSDLRNIQRTIAIRIHTRALTFNPFRFTEKLVDLLKYYKLNALGVHIVHPNEITAEFRLAVDRLQTAVPILFANIPLLKEINDNQTTMHTLCMQLYSIGVIPHYLYHFMPHSPGSTEYRTSVQKGVDIIRLLKRRISNLAVPEFVLPHSSGKHTMPLLGVNESSAYQSQDAQGNPVVRYTNWQGKQIEYPDVLE